MVLSSSIISEKAKHQKLKLCTHGSAIVKD